MTDAAWMNVALERAALALTRGNLPIGGTIVDVGIARVVFGVFDRLVGATGWLSQGDYDRRKGLELVSGVAADESRTLINEYARRTGLRAHMSTERSVT